MTASCGREMLGESVYCGCGFVDKDYETELIAAENADEETRKKAELPGEKPKAKPKKHLTESESLGETSLLVKSLAEYWYCTHCTMDYDYCGNCVAKKSVRRYGKPLPGSLQETSKMDRVDNYSPPNAATRKKSKPVRTRKGTLSSFVWPKQ